MHKDMPKHKFKVEYYLWVVDFTFFMILYFSVLFELHFN